jgi:multicomponent Na+:H+ antiporter subunit G
MSPREVAAVLLFAFGAGVELICSMGVLLVSDTFDRLHFVGPASTVGPAAIAVGVILQEGFNQAGIKAVLVAATLALAGPLLAHATARAARVRQFGHWVVPEGERVDR